MIRRAAALLAIPISLSLASPLARGQADLHFDYTSFETGFGQAQFDVLNYPSINGNYMMTSTDNHRPEMVANGNALAQFYNNFLADYNAQARAGAINAVVEADKIHQYTTSNSTRNGPRPTFLILNEISSSLWSANPGAPSISTYRQWLIDCVTRLHEHYGYEVVTLAPFQNPGANDASWQALQAVSYVGIECYLSGTEVWNSGSTNAQRLAWATSQYQASKNSYMNRGVPADRLMVTEHFSNNNATFVDNQGNTQTTGWGRAGLASAADWDQVIMLRQDAIKAVGFEGFLAYNWGGNSMGVTQAEQIQHEYYYRSRLALPTQQLQWLSDGAINVNGTVIPLSWGQPLNWIGGVPNAAGAVANFYRTNTAARTVTLDGNKTAGVVTFNSPASYTIAAGTGGTLVLMGSGGGPATVGVVRGDHTVAANVQLQSNTTFAVNSGALTVSGAVSGTGALFLTTGTLVLSGNNTYTGGTTVNGGTLVAAGGDAFAGGALTVNGGATAQAQANLTKPLRLRALTTSGTGKLDLTNNDLLIDYTGASAESHIRQLVKNGRELGTGITTLATPGNDTVLAVADNAHLNRTSWLGVPIHTTTIIGKYTYFGDANLDGKVTGDDYLNVDANLGTGDSWLEGDFDMSGVTTGDDYLAIDANLGKGTSNPLAYAELKAEMVQLHRAMFGEEYLRKLAEAESNGFSPVPEPEGFALVALASIGAFRRRCRR